MIWDHPRTRGEKFVFQVHLLPFRGSPPHTRGKVDICVVMVYNVGITPAHAGKSVKGLYYFLFVKDHPRTRGEKLFSSHAHLYPVGSPPHTRGKVTFNGKPVLDTQDHPRTRGEKTLTELRSSTILGSPPHTRGKVSTAPVFPCYLRITPAHAGKRLPCRCFGLSLWDHPRTRGEKFVRNHCKRRNIGSPPHTRGKDPCHQDTFLLHRITPAHAGKSERQAIRICPLEDHPRTRGEKFVCFHCNTQALGSPPHTRGKVCIMG